MSCDMTTDVTRHNHARYMEFRRFYVVSPGFDIRRGGRSRHAQRVGMKAKTGQKTRVRGLVGTLSRNSPWTRNDVVESRVKCNDCRGTKEGGRGEFQRQEVRCKGHAQEEHGALDGAGAGLRHEANGVGLFRFLFRGGWRSLGGHRSAMPHNAAG